MAKKLDFTDENFWGRIDPFLVAAVVVLLSALYAVPKLLTNYAEVQVGFYAGAAFILLFDAYGRGILKFPRVLVKGPLMWPLIIVTGITMFVVVFLAIPYLLYALILDLVGMLNISFETGMNSLVSIFFSVLLIIWFAMDAVQGFQQKLAEPAVTRNRK
ncbi:MAG: hypothetical protein V1835_05425 [Candidatus Micrarchaeota archaeon]